VTALLPGADRPGVEGAIGAPIRWCDGVSELLDAIAERPSAATLAVLEEDAGGEGVSEALAARIGAEASAGVLFLFARNPSVERVLAAEEAGAATLLPHPPDPEILERDVAPVVRESGGVKIPGDAGPEGSVVGRSPMLVDVFRTVGRVAPTSATILITGESGTGKELVARTVHQQSDRGDAPFVPVNCAAIPDTLLEAELFGHERGAFTGAVGRSEGRFGRAHGGTLFLDEVGEMSLALQAKLLRVLDTGEVERLGSREVTRVDARIVAATNRDLEARVEKGRFREDLLFRLAVVEVTLPPLRERPEDVKPLALHFAARFGEAHSRPVESFSETAMELLEAHDWPGNVRELRNAVDRAVLLARGGVIRSVDLKLGREAPRTSPLERPAGAKAGAELAYPPTLSLREVEARHIRRVLEHTKGHMGEAAEILGIHRNTMTVKVREYEIDVDALGRR